MRISILKKYMGFNEEGVKTWMTNGTELSEIKDKRAESIQKSEAVSYFVCLKLLRVPG